MDSESEKNSYIKSTTVSISKPGKEPCKSDLNVDVEPSERAASKSVTLSTSVSQDAIVKWMTRAG